MLSLGAIALYALSNERRELLYNVDYSVLVFFATMFVFTAALWTSGLIPEIMSNISNPVADHNNIRNNAIISIVSVAFSQILSNVPFVVLYNNVMIENGFNADDVSMDDAWSRKHYSRQSYNIWRQQVTSSL